MTLAADIAGDWRYIDGIETVTFTRRAPAGDTAVTGARAHRGELSFRETQLGGPAGIEADDIVWTLWSETLEGSTPHRGDTITDGNADVWSIVSAAETTIGSTSIKYRCVCRRQ
jgi:hypothetical protein